jgi:hypothetical protein
MERFKTTTPDGSSGHYNPLLSKMPQFAIGENHVENKTRNLTHIKLALDAEKWEDKFLYLRQQQIWFLSETSKTQH